MANFETLKTAIDANINTNGKQAITGSVVNNVMHQMVDATSEQLTELDYYAGVQSDLNVLFEDKEDGSIDVIFNNRVIFIKNGHKGFNLTFDSYPQTFNVPKYSTLALNVETQNVSVQNMGDGVEVQNNLILLHNEPKGVFNGVFANIYNRRITDRNLENYKKLDVGGCVFSPANKISITRDGNNLIFKFNSSVYYIVNDYTLNANYTIAAGTEVTLKPYELLAANVETKTIEHLTSYESRNSKYIVLAYQEGGVVLNGLLKGYYDRELNNASELIKSERAFFDLEYSVFKPKTWVSDANVETGNDSNFNMYEYEVGENTKMELFVATGGGFIIFVDDDGNVLSSYKHTSNSYTSQWVELDVPVGASKIKITQAVKKDVHPYAEPLRVRGNRVETKPVQITQNLIGKKVVFFGDSITEQGYYVDAFQRMTGCSIVKRGASGTSFTKTTGRGYEDSLSERIDLPSTDAVGNKLGLPENADLVVVLAGVNDWGQRDAWKIDLGTIEAEIDKTNFTGAVRYVFSKLREKYPSTPIVVLSMLHTYHPTSFTKWAEIAYADGQFGGSVTYKTDKDGNTMDVWRKRVGEVARFYGIPYIDMTQCGFTPFIESDNIAFMPDGLHPNEQGGEIMAGYIVSQIKSLFNL